MAMISDQHGEPLHEAWGEGLYRLGKVKLGAPKAKGLKNLPTFRFDATELSEFRRFSEQAGEKAQELKIYAELKERAETAQGELEENIKSKLGTLTPDRLLVWLPSENPMDIVRYQNQLWGRGATLRCWCDGHVCHPLQQDGTRPRRKVPTNAAGELDCQYMRGEKAQCRLAIVTEVHIPDLPGSTDGVFHVESKAINIFAALFHELRNIRGNYGRLMRADIKLHKKYQPTSYRNEKGQKRDSWQWIVHLNPWGDTLREAVDGQYQAVPEDSGDGQAVASVPRDVGVPSGPTAPEADPEADLGDAPPTEPKALEAAVAERDAGEASQNGSFEDGDW